MKNNSLKLVYYSSSYTQIKYIINQTFNRIFFTNYNNYIVKLSVVIHNNEYQRRVMIQPQALVQTYFVQTDVA